MILSCKRIVGSITVFILCLNASHSQIVDKERIESYAPCSLDADCRPNSFCFGNDDNVKGKCKCLSNYILTFRNSTFYECAAGIPLEEACEKDIECQIIAGQFAECNRYKICTCKSEAQVFKGKCYEKLKIGDICISDGNCYFLNNEYRAFCSEGRCQCRVDQRPSEDRSRCISAKKLGESCISDEECTSTVPNTRCLNRCECATQYTLSRNESSCIKVATEFDEPCDFDGQCSALLSESICDGHCTCSSGKHGYGNRCVRTRKSGESCSEDAECIYEKALNGNVNCTGMTCHCIYGSNSDGTCRIEKIDDSSSCVRQTMSKFILLTIFVPTFYLYFALLLV